MPLFLNNEEVEQALTMKTCMEALENLYRELGAGSAVAAARTDIHSPTVAAKGADGALFKEHEWGIAALWHGGAALFVRYRRMAAGR